MVLPELGKPDRALSVSESKWQLALDAAPGVFAVVSLRGIEVANLALARMAGVANREALVGANFAELFESERMSEVQAALDSVLSERTPRSPVLARVANGAAELAFSLGYGEFAGEPVAIVLGRDVLEQRRATERAEQKDALYQRLAEHALDVVTEYDADMRLIFVSPSVFPLLGLRPDQFVGRHIREVVSGVIHPDDVALAVSAIGSIETGASPSELTLRTFHADGSLVWLDIRAVKRATDKGDFHVLFTMRDVTERERAMEALRASEQRFQSLASSVPVVVLGADLEGRCLYVNERWREFTGREPSEAHGFGFRDAFHPDDRLVPAAAFAKARATGSAFQLEHRFQHKNGEIRWGRHQTAPERDAAGRLVGWAGSITDVTDLKNAEAALASEQARTQLALEAAEATPWEYDIASKRFLWSEDAERVLSIPRGSLPRDSDSGLTGFHPDDSGVIEQGIAALLAGSELRMDIRLLVAGAEPVWLAARGRFDASNGDPPSRVAGIVTNINAAKQVEAERAALETKLQHAQRLESLGLLAGGVAHDFNNLLVGILGNAELALGVVADASPAARLIEDLRDAALRAAELSRQILTFSGRRSLAREPVDLGTIAEELPRLLSPALLARAELRVETAAGIVVEGDATQLRQVAMNLITNAADALPEAGGTIVVRVFAEASGERRARLEVQDSGRGMNAATRAHIFDPFFTTKATGRGLGLAVVHGVVRAHAGEIAVESELGAGTRMCVSFPLSVRAVAADVIGAASVAPREHTLVLIVDDEPAVANVAARMLTSAGLRSEIVHDSASALAVLAQRRDEIGLVLLDLTLRGESGADLVPRLRELAPALPVLLMSGYAADDALANISAGEVAGFLSKPFRVAALLEKVQGALSASRAS